MFWVDGAKHLMQRVDKRTCFPAMLEIVQMQTFAMLGARRFDGVGRAFSYSRPIPE